jgi:hypothetical protein
MFEKDPEGQLRAAATDTTMISGFFGALRREEAARADLGAIRKYWDEAVLAWEGSRHIPLMLAPDSNVKLGRTISVSHWRQRQNLESSSEAGSTG